MYKLMTQQLRHFSRTTPRQITPTAAAWTTKQSSEQKIYVSKALEGWDEKLRSNGVGDIDFNLKCIVAKVLQRKFNTLKTYHDVQFNQDQLQEFERLCEARCARMPLQHIVGEWDFMDITLKTSPTVFIPRPETEEFVSKVINIYRNYKEPLDMLEVGCGSGAMSLAILHALPNIKSTAVERSKAATALAWENAKMLNLQDRFVVYNHTTAENDYLPKELEGRKFDLIISNPPYVKSEEFPLLQPEVKLYENLNALDGGPDGLRIARLVFDCACIHLKPGGKMWLELGNDHPPLVQTIIDLQYEGRLRFISGYEDQYKRNRFVEIEKV
ncbi:MTRF1L release factor glutamine methyltransferase [Stomoxys calcitrans]|uniref:peptide chain release factor N(5)-glutamine methyltransferase n=1 Tax=Stomoxys calcitrans TaxID=35570 RepID=A0A1I8Q145_STOCA|nr:MTRF1L release factor glutamine methyltransferase [Stomoxys calcitrans]